MGLVRRLPSTLIDKIAAGEVVERPASVVKELAENAVDARAETVRVRLTQGGLGSITIIDDGVGMSREDALLAMERHATSKLVDEDGLFHILTKGFRGEALPSIASVSRFTLCTTARGASEGTQLIVEGGGPIELSSAAPVAGTRIDVEELFYNVPARRKFLKRESTETGHCEEAVIRLALAHPEVGFFLEHEGRALFQSPAAGKNPQERVIAALGPEVAPHLLAIDEQRLDVRVTGFVASSEYTLPTARGLYTFVNNRYIRDRGLISAVQRAYQDSLPPGRQPVAVVHIELNPRAVDVNVHPQKLEVRFADPRTVQECVGAAITRALKAAPWRGVGDAEAQRSSPDYALAVDRFLQRAATPSFFEAPPAMQLAGGADRPGFGTARPQLNDAPPPGFFRSLTFMGVLGRRLWVCEATGGSLTVIDPKAVRHRLVLHALSERFTSGELSKAPPTLFQATVTLNEATRAALEGRGPALHRVGVEVEPFGGDTLIVRKVPKELEEVDCATLLSSLALLLPADADAAAPRFVEGLDAMAAHAAEKASATVSFEDARAQLAQLESVDFEAQPCEVRIVVHQVPLLELVSEG